MGPIIMRARHFLIPWTLLMACGDDASPADAGGSSSAAGTSTTDPSTSAATTDAPTTSASTGGEATTATTDPDGSSGGTPGGTPGCGLDVASGAGTVQIQVGPDTREYLLVIPDGYDPNTPTALVFAWHGRGGSGELARLYFQVEAASGGQAIMVYPDGLPLASMGGQTGWDLGAAGYDVDFFDAMVDQLSQGACIDLDRVFSTGHSFGGYMSNALGCFRPDVLRAIAPVAGGPPFGACQDGTVAAWLTHGTGDQVVPFSQGEQARDSLLGRNGCGDTTTDVDPSPCTSYDGCAEGTPVVWCPHEEPDLNGHGWPRFAGSAIWAFFDAQAPKP